MKKGWYILLYHNVSWEENPFIRGIGGTCPPDMFREHLDCLEKAGEFVSIADGIDRLQSGKIAGPMFSFWFDDGLSGVRQYALPLLQKWHTTGTLSICSRFVNRSELFWRCKLSYLSYLDGLRFLRTRLRKYGFKSGNYVKDFCYDKFAPEILKEIDTVYNKFTTEIERKDAFRLFETDSGIVQLARENWTISNHTAAHYPVGEDIYADKLIEQFEECENTFKTLFNTESQYWVLPFGDAGTRASNIIETFMRANNNRYFILVGNRINYPANLKNRIIFRIGVPLYNGKDLVRYLNRL
jgi:hypothetical protein